MSKPLDLKQKQITALCKGAKAAGYAPFVQIGNTWVMLVPEERAILPQGVKPIDAAPNPEAFDTLEEYLAWRDRSGAREN
jgi:hypothetical protein